MPLLHMLILAGCASGATCCETGGRAVSSEVACRRPTSISGDETWKETCFQREHGLVGLLRSGRDSTLPCGCRADMRRQHVTDLLRTGGERACALLNAAGREEGRVAVVLALPGINPHQRTTSKDKRSPRDSLVCTHNSGSGYVA